MFSLRAEFALWLSARNCRESPFAVMKRTTLLAVLSAAILFVTAGDAQPLPFSWSADYAALGWAVCGLLLPVLLFCLLDAALGASAWDWVGPATKTATTTEPARRGRFVLHPMNTHSSHAHTGMGAYILARACAGGARAGLASAAMGVGLIAMGLASFAWWASRRRRAQAVDNWLMEVHLLACTCSTLAVGFPWAERWLVVGWAVVAAVRWATFTDRANLLVTSSLVIVAGHVSAHRLGGAGVLWRYVGGMGVVLNSLALKMVDTAGRGSWGTAAFHYAAAAGLSELWAWSQTLPAS